MEINIGNKRIISKDFSEFERAWSIADAIFVLEYLKCMNNIVLGGDILTEKLEHNYDNWYYEVDSSRSLSFNIDCSIKWANEYISNYIRKNGTSFYVIFVVR